MAGIFPTQQLISFHFIQGHTELSVLDRCVLLGCRVVITAAGQDIVISQLHETHPGIIKMKMLARSYLWY